MKMTKKDQDAWIKMVDESRLEVFIILDQIGKGFVQEEDLEKIRRLVNPLFDLVTVSGPDTWNKVLELSNANKSEKKIEIAKN